MDLNFLSRLFSAPQPVGTPGINPDAPAPMTAPVNIMQGMTQATGGASSRRSLLGTIGGIADVLAKVGGAEPMYQPTLDARQGREIALANNQQQVDLQRLRMETAQGELTDANNARLGQAARGLQAIQRRNPNVDVSSTWRLLAERAGIDPQQVVTLGEQISTNPDFLTGLIGASGEEAERYGGNLIPVRTPDGKITMFQPSLGQGEARNVLPEGYSVAVDPDTQYSADSRRIIAEGNNRTDLRESADRITGIRIADAGRRYAAGVRAQTGTASRNSKTPDTAAVAKAAAPIVSDLRNAIGRLYESGGMSGPGNNTLNVMARESVPGYERLANPEGYSARQDLDRLLTTGIPALLPLMGGLSLGGRNMDAARELETWRNAIASAKDYRSAIRAVETFERRIGELQAPVSAPRQTGTLRPRTPARAPIRPRGNGGTRSSPSVSNW